METKINIAEILKDKPKGTKLYTNAFGELRFDVVSSDKDEIIFTKTIVNTSCCFYNDGKYSKYGEPILVPSKEMQDWSKFAWKKGDVLVSNDGDRHIIFKGFSNADYTTFKGKHWISVSKKRYVPCWNIQNTQDYHIENNKEAAQTYINTIEGKLGGKLNLETLEIEKPAYKYGDIVLVDDTYLRESPVVLSPSDIKTSRPTTDSERQQLFDALAKEGKAWDAKKKMIVDLKPNVDELKPFDKVLVRNDKEDQWSANIFSYQVRDNMYYCLGECYWRYCIPYEGNESLLGTTKDVEG